jgi:hypothetical protein
MYSIERIVSETASIFRKLANPNIMGCGGDQTFLNSPEIFSPDYPRLDFSDGNIPTRSTSALVLGLISPSKISVPQMFGYFGVNDLMELTFTENQVVSFCRYYWRLMGTPSHGTFFLVRRQVGFSPAMVVRTKKESADGMLVRQLTFEGGDSWSGDQECLRRLVIPYHY